MIRFRRSAIAYVVEFTGNSKDDLQKELTAVTPLAKTQKTYQENGPRIFAYAALMELTNNYIATEKYNFGFKRTNAQDIYRADTYGWRIFFRRQKDPRPVVIVLHIERVKTLGRTPSSLKGDVR